MDSITRSNVFSVERVMRLMKEVILEEESREILQTTLLPMEYLLHHIATVLQDQLSEAARETVKVWLQLLHNCLNNNMERASKQIKNWRVRFNYLFQSLENDLSPFVSLEAVIAPIILLMNTVIEEEEKYHILPTELRPVHNLLLEVSAGFLQDQHKAAQEALKIWLQLLHGSLIEANSILHRCDPLQQQPRHDCLTDNPGTLPKQVKEWKVLFNYLFQGLHEEFSMFVTSTSHQIINRVPIPHMSEEESLQQLSKDEAWILFTRIAFEDNPVPMDIEECAKNIADECKGFRLAIILVAAAMRGETRVDEWKTSLSSIKSAYSSSEPDALPNSDLKNCFLYCAMYTKDETINVQELVQMWIAEGLVRSKQGNHLMDMAIGLSYVNLLVDRCLFQRINISKFTMLFVRRQYILVRRRRIVYSRQSKGCKIFQRFIMRTTKRISVRRNFIKNLPAEFPCPKLVSLMLSIDDSIEEVPPGFLVSLTSLKVLHLQEGIRINSIPSSVGQLKQLEFLS